MKLGTLTLSEAIIVVLIGLAVILSYGCTTQPPAPVIEHTPTLNLYPEDPDLGTPNDADRTCG